MVGLLSRNNKSTRYAANLQTTQTPDSVIALSHAWITEVLKDIAVFAESQNQPKVAALISAARNAVIHLLGTDDTSGKNIGAKEELWFGIVLDELARYCHIHGLTETEKHLLAALSSWHEAQETEKTIDKVITFRPKLF